MTLRTRAGAATAHDQDSHGMFDEEHHRAPSAHAPVPRGEPEAPLRFGGHDTAAGQGRGRLYSAATAPAVATAPITANAAA